MNIDDLKWNDEARGKILEDSDRVLREAATTVNDEASGQSYDDVYEKLFAALKDRFIDFKPGPDIEAVAKAIADGELS